MPARGPDDGDAARLIACAGLAFHVLSYYVEDTGHSARVDFDCGDGLVRVWVYDPEGCVEASLESAVRVLPRLLRAPLLDVEGRCGGRGSYGFEGLSRLVYSTFRRSGFYEWLKRVSAGGREHFLVVGWNGAYAEGAGSEDRVSLPMLSAPLIAHTHPGLCYPSWRDVLSAADFFSSGGLAEAIVSPVCGFMVRVTRPFSIDCLEALEDTAHCIRRAGGEDEYLQCLSRLGSAGCIAAEML